MPIYEFVCQSCGHEFEHLARSMDEGPVPCPICRARKTRRKLSAFAARQRAEAAAFPPRPAPCGRCGDPDGPCGV